LIPGTSGWRLPTEAQWEFAARGGEPHRFAGSNDAKAVAWTQEEAKHPMPVCTKARNGFDLCDMSGNVGEWVADWSASYGDSGIQVEPLGPADGDLKVVRGGGFNQSSAMATVSHRGAMTPTAADRAIGFRLVRP
jgi:formylglycine-generating enzyme required for sulfatase activity